MPFTALACIVLLAAAPAAPRPFAITVVDEQTDRGVPLVELRTVHGVRLVTDSNGIAAFAEPGLMDREVYFHVFSHGYEFPKDGFGFRGKALKVAPGGAATLKVRRLNVAERLYRVTGGGIYADSLQAGVKVPLKEPALNAQVVGSDSVMGAVYNGKLFWFWGDTNRVSYPLGNFDVPGATSELPGQGGLDPEVGVDLTYFPDEKGFAKPTMKMPGKGPTWMTSLVPLKDRGGKERLYATYVKVEPPLKAYARGLAVWDDDKKEFARLAEFDPDLAFNFGHALRHTKGGVEYVYFAHPYPLTRVRATAEDFRDIKNFECYTCLKEGTRPGAGELDRDGEGKLRYSWKKNTPAVGPAEQEKLIKAGKMKPGEALLRLRDRDTGKPVALQSGTVNWNEHRKKWVAVAVQLGGTSLLGEVWYAEADAPLGPWSYAAKVVTHEKYSFYNPRHHPAFDKDGGRVIFFEGTYTNSFSGNPDVTPRYEYNQVMYKLDLGDRRLALPASIKGFGFLALDRAGVGTVALTYSEGRLRLSGKDEKPLFHAVPTDAKDAPAATVPLYEYRDKEGKFTYSTEPALKGRERAEKPVCRVWPAP